MSEPPEKPKTRAEEAAPDLQMFFDFLLRLADRVTRLEREVLELQQHANIDEFAEDEHDDEGHRNG